MVLLHCALASCGAVYCNRSCLWVCLQRAGGVRALLQPARAQCLRLSERFFHCYWTANSSSVGTCPSPPGRRALWNDFVCMQVTYVFLVKRLNRSHFRPYEDTGHPQMITLHSERKSILGQRNGGRSNFRICGPLLKCTEKIDSNQVR